MLDLNEAAFPLQEMYNNRVTIHDNDKNLDYF